VQNEGRQNISQSGVWKSLSIPSIGTILPGLQIDYFTIFGILSENKNMFEDHNPCASWDREKMTDAKRHLIRAAFNMQVCDKDTEYVLNMTPYAYVALCCLHKMDFFGKREKPLELQDEESYIGQLLYHFLRGVEETSHEIFQFEEPGLEYCGTLDPFMMVMNQLYL
jgi:hypothetical protein